MPDKFWEFKEGDDYRVKFRCRDIGYGVELGNGVLTYDGRDGNKHAFTVAGGDEHLYLFDDEIRSAGKVQ
jgi:hypothetical protein